METRASFVIVGAFVLSFFVAIVMAVVWLADVDIDDDVVLYDIFFEGSVSGLSVGNPVRYGGIPIGIVTDMRISQDRFGEIQVVIEVPEDTPIREDAVASLEYQGITGVGFIQIDGGTESARPLTAKAGQKRPEIRSEKSSLQQVFESAPEIMADLETLAEQATKLLNDKNVGHIQNTLANIDRFSAALSESSEDVALILQEGATTMEQFRRTASEAERFVGAFADRSETLAGAAETTVMEAQALVQDMRAFTQRLDTLAMKATPVLDNANAMVQGYADLGEDMRGEVGRLSSQLSETLDRMDGMIGNTDARIAMLLVRAQQSLDTVDATLKTADNRINDVADTAEDTLADYSQLAGSVAPLVEGVARDASSAVANFSSISADLRLAASNIAAAADEAKNLIAENRDPVTSFTSTGLYEFTQLLADMRTLVSSLTRITNQIERDPAQFFFGDSQQGYEVQ